MSRAPSTLRSTFVFTSGTFCRAILMCIPQATRFGGTVFIIGVGSKSVQTYPFMYASFREIDIRFQFRYHETYPKAITLVEEGLIDLKPLVTHRFTLKQAQEAFEAASTPSARAVKVQLLDD